MEIETRAFWGIKPKELFNEEQISISWLMQLHNISLFEALDLLKFANESTIYFKSCYGTAETSIVYKHWLESLKKLRNDVTEIKECLLSNENPYYEKWKPGRPSKTALETRAKYWHLEMQTAGVTHISASKTFLKNPKGMKLLTKMVSIAQTKIFK